MSWLRETLGVPSKRLLAERARATLTRPHPAPLFLFGNQKSGGTAIAGLLSAATGLRAALDLEGTTAPRFARLVRGKTTLEDFVTKNAWSFSAPIVKDGNLTFVAEPLMAHFGVARAIFILRNPCDNIRSILDRLKLPGDLAHLDVATIRANATWRGILSGGDLDFSPDHYVSILARRWRQAAEICEAGGDAFVRVRYEDFLADKRGEIERLGRAFDLETPNDIGALLERDYQRRGNPAVALRKFFGEENSRRIADICGEAAGRLGYVLH